jgi:hypothetical protein
LARLSLGINSAAKAAIMAITTNNSMRLKPLRFRLGSRLLQLLMLGPASNKKARIINNKNVNNPVMNTI